MEFSVTKQAGCGCHLKEVYCTAAPTEWLTVVVKDSRALPFTLFLALQPLLLTYANSGSPLIPLYTGPVYSLTKNLLFF